MAENLEEYLEFAKDIAKYAGEVMLKYFKENNGASYKGDKTIVTLADTEINAYLIKKVKEKLIIHEIKKMWKDISNHIFGIKRGKCMTNIFIFVLII